MKINYDNVGKWVSVLYRQFQVYINAELKSFDLNSSQYIFLLILYRQDGVSQEELARRLFIDKGAAARAIKQLEQNGLLTRKVNALDKRAYEVYLTEKALKIRPLIEEILDRWNRILSQDRSEEENIIVIEALKDMSANALRHHREKLEV
jgi:DNA-binding MarR family transcriptional regulator